MGDASYATLYLPFDVTTDANTKAYYVSAASSGYALLTPTSNEGHDIPAVTAVVLVNDNAAKKATFDVARGLTADVDAGDNLLKGTLVDMSLDLSETSPYYSLGRLDGKIGFYKFNNNGTTTITCSANKAYLQVPEAMGVKGFTLVFGGEDGIREMDKEEWSMGNDLIFNIAGQRVSKPTHGIYIINGKKVFVK